MKKRGGRVILLLALILVVAVAAGLLWLSKGGQIGIKPAQQPTPAPTKPPVKAIVVIKDLQPDFVLTQDNAAEYVALKDIPAEQFQLARNLTEIESVYNKRISSTLPLIVNTPLDRRNLAEPPLSYQIPSGRKGVPVLVNATSGVGHLIAPGDVVDVILLYDISVIPDYKLGQGELSRMEPCYECPPNLLHVVKTVAQNIKVLRVVDYPPAESRTSEQQLFLVLLAMTDQEAEIVKFAELVPQAEIQLVVRSYFDTAEEITTGITDKLLLEKYLPVPCPIMVDGTYPKFACTGGAIP